jgi:CTP synthase
LDLPEKSTPDLKQWNQFLYQYKNPKHIVTVALVGKYVELQDSYKSILEAFIHAGASQHTKVNVVSVHSEYITRENVAEKMKNFDGILVAPGFGERGIEGKIETIKYAREKNIPFFGICLGMQMAVIEFSRNVLNYKDANSTEMDEATQHPVINLMESQKNIINKGGTMRLGAWKCELKTNSLAHQIYQNVTISERHRHRYEFNNQYLEELEKAGMKATGVNPDTNLIEIIEIPTHKFFIGVQYHPEYKSTVANPHPVFIEFVKAMVG